MRFFLTFLVISAIWGGVMGCHRGEERPGRSSTPEATPVTVAVVTNVAWEKSVSIVGTLYPKDEATIAAQVEGQVERTLVDFGDRVRAGQELALIDTAAYDAQLQQAVGNLAKAEAALLNARQNFKRIDQLREDKIASAGDHDQSKAQLEQAEAEVKAARGAEAVARLHLQHSQVLAPFDGAVAQRFVGRGDYVKSGTPLFNVVNDAVLKFIFQVPERYASFVEKRLPVTFSVDNYPGKTFRGAVYLISPSVSQANRAFGVGALVTNTDFRLKANTFARGALVLERAASTTAVPVEAIVNFAGITRLFVVEKNIARRRTVETGRIRDGLQEIVKGLRPGELVVTSGQNRLTDGSPVVTQMAGPKKSEMNPPREHGSPRTS